MQLEPDPEVWEIIQLTDKKLLIIDQLLTVYTRFYERNRSNELKHQTPSQYQSWLNSQDMDICMAIYNRVKIRTRSEDLASSIE